MGFGAGVLISALSFDLMDEAWQRSHQAGSGFLPVAAGFLGGAALFTACNFALGLWGARHRKRSTTEHRTADKARHAPKMAAPWRSARCSTASPNRS